MDLVTVVVPVYNTEKYLDRCIKSIVGQSYKNLEIILVDDGSPDSCPQLCDRWATRDSRIKVVHKENAGLSSARNVGIESCSGDFITFIDSDDYISPVMIDSLLSAVKKHGVNISICGFIKGNDNDYRFNNDISNNTVEVVSSDIALKRIYESDGDALKYVTAWGKLYDISLFEQKRYPVGKLFEDMYVTHELIYYSGSIAVLDACLIYYYQHGDSIMNKSFHLKKLDYLEALKLRTEFFEDKKQEELAGIAYDDYLHSLIWEYSRVRDILHDKQAMKDIWNRYKAVYKNNYCSKRYQNETRLFLKMFYLNPEVIILYWRISAKLKRK